MSNFSHLEPFKKLKSKGKMLDIILTSSEEEGKNHGIHSEVISALNLPIAVRNKITKKTNEEPKIIELNLPDDAISALVKFAYTGEIENEYLEPPQKFWLE